MGIEDNYLVEILYVIKMGEVPHKGLSYFNRHDIRLLELSPVLAAISRLQENMAAVFCSKEVAIRNRLAGVFPGYKILFVETYEELKNHPHTIKVIFADQTPVIYKANAGEIIVSQDIEYEGDEGVMALRDLAPETLKKKILEAISQFDGSSLAILDKLKEYVGFEPGYSRIRYDTIVPNGFFFRPIVAVLESLRIDIRKREAPKEFLPEHMILLTNLIIQVRRQISSNLGLLNVRPAVDCYFSDISSNLDFLVNNRSYTAASLKERGERRPRALADAIRYSNQGSVLDGDPDDEYIAQIEQERCLLDCLIALSAANHVAPVIKVPLSNSLLFSKVSDLATVDRGNRKKTDAMMKRLKGVLASYLNEWLEYFDSSISSSIKLVSNLPLEWANHEGLPIMIRHEVSRIPVTPGYVATKLLLDQDTIHLDVNAFKEILFISSFSAGDPIRDHLKEKLKVIQEIVSGPDGPLESAKSRGLILNDMQVSSSSIDVRINWVEVSNRSELVEAVNRSSCAVTVFDLHGGHSTQGGGVIELKDEIVSVFDICREMRISPIVILSACDTSPIDKGHYSTADAFFLAGAKTLISSVLPINSDLASTFLARLLLRIKSFLPVRVRQGFPIRWSELITGMTRRAYYHELINRLQRELRFSREIKHDLLFEIGSVLDPLRNDWKNLIDHKITSFLEISAYQLRVFIDEKAQFMECMKYVQLGRPESIIISDSLDTPAV